MSNHVVIVGGGQAGLQASISLRQEGYQGRISLICDEDHLPYMRPPLSKAFMKSENEVPVQFRDIKFFLDNRIEVRTSVKALAIRPDASQLVIEGGEIVHYHHLILATGARPRPWRGIGTGARNVHYLRSLGHAREIRHQLAHVKDICILGGGYVGLELAATASQLGKRVTVVESTAALLSRSMIPWMSEWLLKLHLSNGVAVRLQTQVPTVKVDEEERVTEVITDSGETIPVDMVLVGIGAIPNTELAEKAGLRIANGIVVNSSLRTSVENIYAIGDCASFPDPKTEKLLRLESVQNAVDQAKFVAREISLGCNATFAALAWFWSVQYQFKIMIAGALSNFDRFEVTGLENDGRFNIDVYYKDKLNCVFSVNDAKYHLKARRLLK